MRASKYQKRKVAECSKCRRVMQVTLGMCQVCYLRDRAKRDHARTIPTKNGPILPKRMPEPTQHPPGSPEKVAELARRYQAGEFLYHPYDEIRLNVFGLNDTYTNEDEDNGKDD